MFTDILAELFATASPVMIKIVASTWTYNIVFIKWNRSQIKWGICELTNLAKTQVHLINFNFEILTNYPEQGDFILDCEILY